MRKAVSQSLIGVLEGGLGGNFLQEVSPGFLLFGLSVSAVRDLSDSTLLTFQRVK
jgi:hypothetical protein